MNHYYYIITFTNIVIIHENIGGIDQIKHIGYH